MNADLRNRLQALVAAESLPSGYLESVETFVVPLADWLFQQCESQAGPLFAGLHGGQGSGKTTLCRVLEVIAEARGQHIVCLSLDDFYLGRRQREVLADTVHPLLRTRGVPGTHDIAQLSETVTALLGGESVRLPRFDKSTDDCQPAGAWPHHPGGAELILLEGWCVGVPPQPLAALESPANSLEAVEDPDARWRRYVNEQLAGPYADMFGRMDALVMLKVPGIEQVLEWRQLQEEKLRCSGGGDQVMTPVQVERFVQHYERLTRHALEQLPKRADYVLEIDEQHRIRSAQVREQ